MNYSFAKFCSWVFHPALMPFYGFIVIIYCFPYHYQYIPDTMYNVTMMTMIIMTIIAPAIMMVVLRKLAIIEDIDVSDSKQRILPYLMYIFFYLLTYLIIKPKTVTSIVFMEDPLIAAILLGATISLGIAFFANNFLKVSVHTMGVANVFIFTCLLSKYTSKNLFFVIAISLTMLGLVGGSRIYLKAHTPREVYFGLAIGIIGQVIAFKLYF